MIEKKLQPGEIYAVTLETLPSWHGWKIKRCFPCSVIPPGCPGTNSRFVLLPIGKTLKNTPDL